MRHLTISTIAAGMLVATAVPAPAATLGTIPVDPDQAVSGTVGANERQAWRLQLEQGKYYAVWGSAYADKPTVTVRAAGGKVMGSFFLTTESSFTGVSFEAPYAGLYTVEVACTGDESPYCAGDYTLSAGRDCPGDASTACGIAVGQTLHDLQMRFFQDKDWFRADLSAGTSYTVDVVGSGGPDEWAGVYDSGGRWLAGAVCTNDVRPCLTFAAPRSGRYYVAVAANSDAIPTYDLTLAVLRQGRKPRWNQPPLTR